MVALAPIPMTEARDGLGRRIARIALPTYPTLSRRTDYYYSTAWQVLEERDELQPQSTEVPTDDVRYQYVWDPRYIDALVCRDEDKNADDDCTDAATATQASNTGDEHLYYTQDANFNVTALVDGYDGAVVQRYLYEPYGQVSVRNGVRDAAGTPTTEWAEVVPQNAFANEILFCGYRLDTYSGVYDVRNRMYHPTLGRWLQRDLVGMSPIWDLPYRLGRGIGKAIYDTFVLPPPPEGRGRGRCGLNIDEVFLAMLMRLQGRVNQLRDADRSPWYLADCLFSDAWWFMYGNGNSMDFDIDGRAGCPSGEGCERTVTLCGRCIHNSQVNDMVYGFMARAVGMSEIGAAKWANGLELKTKGKVETPIQRASYILGADLGKWVSTPSEPLTVESMCWQMTQGSLLDSATAGGAYDHCELCQECARPEDVGKDFSTTNWDSNKGPDYTYFGSPSASQPTTGP